MQNRRDFLKTAFLTAAGAGMAIAYPNILRGGTPPSDKIKIALGGAKNMGWSNLQTFLQFPEVECVAVCDVDNEGLNKRAAEVAKWKGKKPPYL